MRALKDTRQMESQAEGATGDEFEAERAKTDLWKGTKGQRRPELPNEPRMTDHQDHKLNEQQHRSQHTRTE